MSDYIDREILITKLNGLRAAYEPYGLPKRQAFTSNQIIDSVAEVIMQMPSADTDWETIEVLSEMLKQYNLFSLADRPYYTALSKAIEALKGEECLTE